MCVQELMFPGAEEVKQLEKIMEGFQKSILCIFSFLCILISIVAVTFLVSVLVLGLLPFSVLTSL